MTLEQLTNQYSENYVLNSDDRRRVISERLIDACQDLLSRDLKAGGKTFKFAGEHDFSEFKEKLRGHFENNDAENSAYELNFIFSGRKKTIEQLVYDVTPGQFDDNIIVEKVIAGFNGSRPLYERLLEHTDPTKRPIRKSGSNNQITFNFERLENRCKLHITDSVIYVYGKKIVGEEYEEEILLHGNQVMATETSPEGITYNVEKSGDLPSDASAREEIMTSRIQDLDDLVESGTIVKYNIEEFSNRTVIKTYFRLLEDYQEEFNVQSIL